jgi:glycosyltransferase involved in cell wall biosynthesis
MNISIIIPAYNEEKYIGKCLTSVVRHKKYFAEIIVVDNASTDDTKKIAERFEGVRIVAEPSKGLTKARQRGFVESSGDIIAYIDADTILPDKWAMRLQHAFDDPQVVCASGPYVYYDTSFVSKLFVWIYWCAAKFIYFFTRFMVIGGNFAVRRNALIEIGGFDPSITFYGEDTNIARRLYKVGAIRFNMRSYIYTSARRLQKEGYVTMAARYFLNFLSEIFLGKPATEDYKDIR